MIYSKILAWPMLVFIIFMVKDYLSDIDHDDDYKNVTVVDSAENEKL